MLTKNDCLVLLTDIQAVTKEKEKVLKMIREVATKEDIPMHIIKYINDNRQFEVAQFYETLRHNYNNKKSSPLYKNLVTEDHSDVNEVLTTLASLNLQILLFAKKLKNSQMFLSHSRAEEITRVLNNYFRTYDLLPCITLLKLIRSDLKVFEGIK